MRQGEKYNYEIVKTNHRTYANSVLEVVKGESLSASRVNYYRDRLTPEENDAGWGVYAQRTTAPVTYRPSAQRPLKRDRGKEGA
jgi:hypothetical protein